jgi:O-antigen/teichoic acid export membrane protein
MMGIKAIAFWSIRRWRTSARFSFAVIKAMAPFSLRLLATDLIASIYNNVAQLFIGKINTSTLGYYAQAQKLKDLPVTSTVQAVQGVTFPALSKIKEDSAKFAEGYLRIERLLGFILFPIMLGFVAIAPDMFMLLLGEKWMPTVPYFEILALSGLCYPLAIVSYNVLKTKSDGRVIVRLEIIKRIIMTAILCYTIPQSVEAIAWGMLAMAAVEFLLNTGAAMRYMKTTFGALLRSIAPSFTIAAIMFGALHYLTPHIDSLNITLRLTTTIAAGGALYLLLAWIFRLRALRECVALLRGMLTKSA